MATASDTPLMTAEEFAARPDEGPPEELENGRIVAFAFSGTIHGMVCANAAHLIGRFVESRGLDHSLCLGSGVITTRDPDSVRGPDVSIYPQDRVPAGRFSPTGYHPIPPEFIVEIKSAEEPWSRILRKTSEYLACGVDTVVVLDPERQSAQVYTEDAPVRLLAAEDDLTLDGSLDGFREKVGRFYE